jgi:plasmid replication initiation protein
MAATPYEILTFVDRGTSARDYHRLKGGFDRLQSTTVLTSIRQPAERRRHPFLLDQRVEGDGRCKWPPIGLESTLPDWFLWATAVRQASLPLQAIHTLHRAASARLPAPA